MYDFGSRLKELRMRRKLSQQQLADRLNVKKASVSGYENNIATPSVAVLTQMALVFNVSLDYLMGLDHRRTISVENLTPRQVALLEELIAEFRMKK